MTHLERILALDAALVGAELAFPGDGTADLRAAMSLLQDELDSLIQDRADIPERLNDYLDQQKVAVNKLAASPEVFGAE